MIGKPSRKSCAKRDAISPTVLNTQKVTPFLVTLAEILTKTSCELSLCLKEVSQVLLTTRFQDKQDVRFQSGVTSTYPRDELRGWISISWPWCWEGLGAGEERDDRGWDGWMASPTRWTWVWVHSGSWWWTGRPGVLRFMGSPSWTRLSNWTEHICCLHLNNWIKFSEPEFPYLGN